MDPLAVRLRSYSQGDKTKVFGAESEILIIYKRFRWIPSRKASLLLPGGKFTAGPRREIIEVILKILLEIKRKYCSIVYLNVSGKNAFKLKWELLTERKRYFCR